MSSLLQSTPAISVRQVVVKQFTPFFGSSIPSVVIEAVTEDLSKHLEEILDQYSTGGLSRTDASAQILATVTNHLPSFSEEHLKTLFKRYTPHQQLPTAQQQVALDSSQQSTEQVVSTLPVMTLPITPKVAPIDTDKSSSINQPDLIRQASNSQATHPVVTQTTVQEIRPQERPGFLAKLKQYIK